MSTLRKPINIVFLSQVVIVFLVAFGVWPRTLIIPLVILIAGFILWADLETSTAFFIRSVPLFVAIPFTSYFDSFNLWRIASGLIFLKWLTHSYPQARLSLAEVIHTQGSTLRKKYLLTFLFTIFLLFSILSLLAAEDLFAGIKRIIYLVNLSLVPLIVYDLIKKNPTLASKLLKNVLISGIIVAAVGLAQLVSAYLVPLDAFLDFWGNMVQLGFYGYQWASLALEGNTWFAYFGDQLSLRIFSTFPDSHSFPVYLLMTIPALLALLGNGVSAWKPRFQVNWVILLVVFYLLAILSGTRGIWLAILGPLLAWLFLFNFLKKEGRTLEKNLLKKLGLLFLPFFLLFAAAFPIMGSNQFWVEKENNQILAKRIRSILDLNETSNSGRVEIWKKTAASIIKHPLLGVGIGNFPVVLAQHTDLAKAGSSAHNLYLNIAAEIGLIGLLATLGILWIILKRGWAVFTSFSNQGSTFFEIQGRTFIKIYSAAFLLYSLWVLFYSLTDAILFDERAFLIFAINSAVILGLYKTKDPERVKT